MRKKRILITGFGPFPGMPNNPSARIITHLREHFPGEFHTRILPVEYRHSPRAFANACKMIRPDIAICLGVSGSTSTIRIEQLARNEAHPGLEDAKGERLESRILDTSGPASYPTMLPVNDITKALDNAGIEWISSNDAGGYVCNALFYHAVHRSFTTGVPKAVGFVHVPMPSNSLTGQKLAEAVRVIAAACKCG